MDEFDFEPGHLFFELGDPGEQAFLLLDGQVELSASSSAGPSPTRVVSAGDVFGEMALVDERPRDVTARARSAGRAIEIPRDVFEELLLRAPLPILECLRALFERLRSTTTSEHQVPAAPIVQPVAPPAPPARPAKPAARQAPAEFPTSQGEVGAWSVVIHPLTRKAAQSLPEEGLRVTHFPLRLGRAAEAGEKEALDLNDLWLLDEAPYNISRNHCDIILTANGPRVRDRGSHLGCVVNELVIGGPTECRTSLLDPGENVLIVGARSSPYQFRVVVEQHH